MVKFYWEFSGRCVPGKDETNSIVFELTLNFKDLCVVTSDYN